jgi:hypothetical protein
MLKVLFAMSSDSDLGRRSAYRKASPLASTEKAKASAAFADDALTVQLHRLYDSITQEPIPNYLLELIHRVKP